VYVNPAVTGGPLTQGDEIPDASGPGLDNAVFRIYRYPPDYPGLAGRDLTPIGPIEQYLQTASLTLRSGDYGVVTNRGEGTYSYGVGQLVTIEAEANPCCEFESWTVLSGTALIDDPGSSHATFRMTSQDTTIRANFRELVPIPTLPGPVLAPMAIGLLAAANLVIRRRGRSAGPEGHSASKN
jgi:hypothetical protein